MDPAASTSHRFLSMEFTTATTPEETVVVAEAEEEDAQTFLRPTSSPSKTRAEKRRTTRLWDVFGRRLPRSEIVFFCQTFIIYIVVVTSLVNLTLKNGPINLWIALLSSCLGYLLPHPSIDTDQHRVREKE